MTVHPIIFPDNLRARSASNKADFYFFILSCNNPSTGIQSFRRYSSGILKGLSNGTTKLTSFRSVRCLFYIPFRIALRLCHEHLFQDFYLEGLSNAFYV